MKVADVVFHTCYLCQDLLWLCFHIVSLWICLSAGYLKKLLTELFWRVGCMTGNKCLEVGSDSDLWWLCRYTNF